MKTIDCGFGGAKSVAWQEKQGALPVLAMAAVCLVFVEDGPGGRRRVEPVGADADQQPHLQPTLISR